ncbi:DUF721 domain-containing protein [Sphingomonas gilva]|uniref:DUF721 domain-containing protein n=2 Tax=Sphingomonas gilva TaxID=2305907 RepID=A0A396S4M9_9SPHN|nr:DciA family protein [Sphingomonas gilva]RHW18385.1 DUF721 domain-containing protein [Sphingomonas gilva]
MGRRMSERRRPAKPQDRPRGGPAKSVAELVPAIGGAAFRKFGFVQSAIVSRWGEIVGERYAAISQPESLRFPHGRKGEGVLSVVVSGAHAAIMQHVAPEIMERTNRFFGYPAVARVAIRQGQVERRAKPVPRPAPAPIPVELGESLRDIADPELKAVLSALASSVAAAEARPIPVLGKVK